MKNIWSKMYSLGLGVAFTSKEQVEKIVDELVKKGEMTKAESKSLLDDLFQKGNEVRREIDEIVEERVKNVLNTMNIATKEEIRALENRITSLERQLHKEE